MKRGLVALFLVAIFVGIVFSAASIKYTVNPKLIDSSGNETLLKALTVTSAGTSVIQYQTTIANSGSYIPPVISSSTEVELYSDQPVLFRASDGITTHTFNNLYYMNISAVSTGTWVYTVTNNSGYTANVTWRTTK